MNFPEGAPTWLLIVIVALWALREAAAKLIGRGESMAGMAMDWAKDMRETVRDHGEEIKGLKQELALVRLENQALRRWARDLFAQVQEAGIEPVPFSDYYPDDLT